MLLIRRQRPVGEPPDLEPGASPGYGVLRGSAGAGRALQSLAELGFRTRNVHQAVLDADVTAAQVNEVDLGRQYVTVVLGSHLVNTPDSSLRLALLRAAARHLVGVCDVLIEHHPVDWAETAEPTRATPGAEVGMRDVRREPPFVSAVSVFDVGGRLVRQPFTARVLSDAELAAAIEESGLRIVRRLGPTWIHAMPPEPASEGA